MESAFVYERLYAKNSNNSAYAYRSLSFLWIINGAIKYALAVYNQVVNLDLFLNCGCFPQGLWLASKCELKIIGSLFRYIHPVHNFELVSHSFLVRPLKSIRIEQNMFSQQMLSEQRDSPDIENLF